MPIATTCIGCTKADTAPKHRIIVPGVETDVEVAWHYDCHNIATNGDCLICAGVIAVHPDLKDEALGAQLEADFPLHPDLADSVATAKSVEAEAEPIYGEPESAEA